MKLGVIQGGIPGRPTGNRGLRVCYTWERWCLAMLEDHEDDRPFPPRPRTAKSPATIRQVEADQKGGA
jgi:hypothetical protein